MLMEAFIDIEAESGDPEPGSLEGPDLMSEGHAAVKSTEARERGTLVEG